MLFLYAKIMCSMRVPLKLLIITFLLRNVSCTLDVNIPEMKYLADHLQAEECRRLVAALHFTSYNKPNALDAAEGKVSEDISCLRLLLHWNSSKGEGLGETHERMFERLQQIGRHDLADWLGKTVFHELSQDLKKSFEDPFKELISETSESYLSTTEHLSIIEDPNAWLPIDTIGWIIILILSVIIMVIIVKFIYMKCKRRPKKVTERRERIIN